MDDEKMNAALGETHARLMDVIDAAGVDVLWCEDARGLTIIAKNVQGDPDRVNMIKPLKAAMGENVYGATVQ
ncbi:hypothetical protein SAMN05444165_4120 [Paraburkholderia phenazinium]|uniref:Uncharacterized protein n=2 Tax=Paraburkholderia phenazinium TaxID=60549 RepID=A0A1N6KPA0_9BURK|nr:hypothetical protein SAMN05444165_4120 [Paraburkholderia phenazinium]